MSSKKLLPVQGELEPLEDYIQSPNQDQDRRVSLVHILTPEFQGLNPIDFEDIPSDVVERASPSALRVSLLDTTNDRQSPLHGRNNKGRSVVRYWSGEPETGTVWLSVTPQEYGLFSRHVEMLARTAFNSTLSSRDKKLQEATGDVTAKARTDDDKAAANRAAIRQVQGKLPKMEGYLEEEIIPRIELIDKFIEMTRYRNLNRGSYETVRDHFEHLRLYVFGDMLDAVGNQREWSAASAARAERILQKRLYLEGSPADRVQNFKALLELADEYYGHKRAFIQTRIWETHEYIRKNPDAAKDVWRVDQERANEEDRTD
jgi:hypothetical protein